jgi:hypothetical protein
MIHATRTNIKRQAFTHISNNKQSKENGIKRDKKHITQQI